MCIWRIFQFGWCISDEPGAILFYLAHRKFFSRSLVFWKRNFNNTVNGSKWLYSHAQHADEKPVCKLLQAPYRDSLSIWNFLPDIYSYPTLPISFLQKFYLTKIFLWEILSYQNFLYRNAKKFYLIKVSVNCLYVDVSHVTLRWHQLAPAVNKRSKPLNFLMND